MSKKIYFADMTYKGRKILWEIKNNQAIASKYIKGDKTKSFSSFKRIKLTSLETRDTSVLKYIECSGNRFIIEDFASFCRHFPTLTYQTIDVSKSKKQHSLVNTAPERAPYKTSTPIAINFLRHSSNGIKSKSVFGHSRSEIHPNKTKTKSLNTIDSPTISTSSISFASASSSGSSSSSPCLPGAGSNNKFFDQDLPEFFSRKQAKSRELRQPRIPSKAFNISEGEPHFTCKLEPLFKNLLESPLSLPLKAISDKKTLNERIANTFIASDAEILMLEERWGEVTITSIMADRIHLLTHLIENIINQALVNTSFEATEFSFWERDLIDQFNKVCLPSCTANDMGKFKFENMNDKLKITMIENGLQAAYETYYHKLTANLTECEMQRKINKKNANNYAKDISLSPLVKEHYISIEAEVKKVNTLKRRNMSVIAVLMEINADSEYLLFRQDHSPTFIKKEFQASFLETLINTHDPQALKSQLIAWLKSNRVIQDIPSEDVSWLQSSGSFRCYN